MNHLPSSLFNVLPWAGNVHVDARVFVLCAHGKKGVSMWEGGGQKLEYVAQCFLNWASCFLQIFMQIFVRARDSRHLLYKIWSPSSAWIIEVLMSDHLGLEVWMSNTHFSLSVKDFSCARSILSCLFSLLTSRRKQKRGEKRQGGGWSGENSLNCHFCPRGNSMLVKIATESLFFPGFQFCSLCHRREKAVAGQRLRWIFWVIPGHTLVVGRHYLPLKPS